MDPISVLAGIGSVTQLAYQCSSSLYTFISATKGVDDNVRSLHSEVRNLKKTAESIETVLQNPAVQTFQDGALWADAEESLQACAGTLKRFEVSLLGLRGSGTGRGVTIENALRQWKFQFRDEKVAKLRAQLHSHNLALHTILATINIHMASAGPSIVLNEIIPRMEILTKYVMSIERDGRMNDAPAPDEHESFIHRTNSQLVQRAKVVMSRASTVAEGARSSVYGSATISTISDTESLMPEVDIDDTPNRPVRFASSDNLTQNQDLQRAPSEVMMSESYDSDEELDVEMTEKYVKLGDEASQRGDYQRAESFFSKALAKPRLLAQISNPVDEAELHIKYAQTLLQQGKDIAKARMICERLAQTKIKDDSDRRTVLSASFILAQIHFATGSLARAKDLCRRAIDGRRRLYGRGPAYFEAVALMSEICEAQGDNIDSITYAELLPENFEAPIFKKITVGFEEVEPQQIMTSNIQVQKPALPPRKPPTVKHREPSIMSAAPSVKFERYLTETNFVTLPIPLSIIEGREEVATQEAESVMPGRRKSIANFLKRMSISSTEEPIRMVRMTRDEYNKYWIRDSSGRYLGTEPEGSGAERLRRGLTGASSMTLVESRFKGENVLNGI